jgi:hypothetical protein
MKKVGYILITIGFIWASLESVTEAIGVNWINFAIAVAISAVGIFMIRSQEKQAMNHSETLSTNMKTIRESLSQIVVDVKEIRSKIDPQKPQDVHKMIDEKLPSHLENFVDSRKTIGHIHGLEVYANVMNYFATGERYLNRVWSASTDGYIDEVTMYMEKCEEQFEEALGAVNKLN